MDKFPRTMVGGLSLPRLIIGTNWFLGYSHTSKAKDKFITSYLNRAKITDILTTFLKNGVNATMFPLSEEYNHAIQDAENRTGEKMIRIITPHFSVRPGFECEESPESALDRCQALGGHFCFPHQNVTDALIDRMYHKIRDFDKYSKMIRDRGMIPGLSTHMPEAIVIADDTGADVESYIQLYNASGFLLQVEVDWVMRIIHQAKKPVVTIKPLAAGQLLPPVGLAFVWSTLRDQDLVTIGTTTPDEAQEVIDLSLDYISRRLPDHELQKTRSKKSLDSR